MLFPMMASMSDALRLTPRGPSRVSVSITLSWLNGSCTGQSLPNTIRPAPIASTASATRG